MSVDTGPDVIAVDAGIDAAPPPDAAVDFSETAPDLRARGGGCQYAAGGRAGAGSLPASLAALGLLAGLRALRRRRRFLPRGDGRG